MKRIGLLLAAVLTLALWPGVGTAFAGGGLPLVGGGGQDNSAIVVQNVASGNTVQGIGNEAGSNGAVAAANVDQTNVDTTGGGEPGQPDGCGCDRPDSPQAPDQSQPADQQNDAVVVQNVASGNTVQGAFNEAGTSDGCDCGDSRHDDGQNGAVAVANVDQENVDRGSTDEHRCGSCGGSDSSSHGSSTDESNQAVVVQNVASGNTVQGAFNHAGSNGAVAVADVDQKNVAQSQDGDSKWSKDGKDGKDGGGVDQSNHALVVQNVASGNTIQLIGNKAGSNGAVAVADVQQKNVSTDGRPSYGKHDGKDEQGQYGNDDGSKGCGACKPEPQSCPQPKPEPCPRPKPKPCPPPKPEHCPPPEPAPCPPKPCPGAPGLPGLGGLI